MLVVGKSACPVFMNHRHRQRREHDFLQLRARVPVRFSSPNLTFACVTFAKIENN